MWQPAAIIHPDVETEFIGYMGTALAARPEPFTADVTVTTSKAADVRTGRWVIVRDDGGPALGDVRKASRLGVTVWADTETDVADLAHLVAALIDGWPDGGPVVQASARRPVRLADETGHKQRYLTAEVWVTGSDLT